jgi:sialic acid synthase SpsE
MTGKMPWNRAGSKPFFVAELGTGHEGDLTAGKELIRAAARAGASAVKVQNFRTALFLKPDMDSYRLWERVERDHRFFQELKAEAQAQSIDFFATPLDEFSVDDCVQMDLPYLKIASCDLTNFSLLAKVAQTGKAMILSTGYASLEEIRDAVSFLQSSGSGELTLMHCVSEYPTSFENSQLYGLEVLASHFGLPVGLSDHSMGPYASLVAVARGVRLIEKHFTLDRASSGFDHHMSETEDSLRELIDVINQAHYSLGPRAWARTKAEVARRPNARRGLYYASSMSAGDTLTTDSFITLRPENGTPPAALGHFLGRTLKADVRGLTPANLEDLA